MSIWVVRAHEWFPRRSKDKQTVKTLLKYFPCIDCKKRVTFWDAWVFHSMPSGHMAHMVWCTRCWNKLPS